MKQTIEQLIFLAQRVREVMTNAPEKETEVSSLIRCHNNGFVIIYPGKMPTEHRGISISPHYIEIPQNSFDVLQQWADLATDEFNANEGRLKKRNAEWLSEKIKNKEKELLTLKSGAI